MIYLPRGNFVICMVLMSLFDLCRLILVQSNVLHIYCFHPVFVDCAFSVALLFKGKRKNIWNLTEMNLSDLSAQSQDVMCSLLCEIMLTEFFVQTVGHSFHICAVKN